MATKSRNPLRAFLDIKRDELPLAMLMFSYFFLVITIFWILKPLKKTLFLGYYGDARTFDILGAHLDGGQAEQLAKVGNMAVAFLAVIAFTMLARTLRRQQLTYVFSVVCAVLLAAFLAIIDSGTELTAWAFYLFGDLFNTLMVATFFAFLNDSFRPESAKRNYGAIVLGGVSGGAFGSMFVRAKIKDMSMPQWLWICIGLIAVIGLVAWQAGRLVAKNPPPGDDGPEPDSDDAPSKGNAAVEGARLVFKSRYLLAIVGMVVIYEVVSTILDFQFTQTIRHYVPAADQGQMFSDVYTITNVFALVVQLFLTGVVLKKWGVRIALLFMPFAVLGTAGAFAVVPILWLGNMLNTADNGLNYSINQSAREALYTPTTRDEKYKAKAFIDMFAQRSAKALAVGVNIGVSAYIASFSGLRVLSVIVIVLTGLWLAAALYAGRQFEALEKNNK